MKQYRLLLILFAFFTFRFGQAQMTVVSGKVIDKETKEPMPFANIQFKGTKTGTTTDINGNYKIETYYASDSLVASFIGYTPQAKKLKKK